MAGLTVWKKQEMNRFKKDMDRLFERLWDDFHLPHFPVATQGMPQIDIAETEDSLVINGVIPDIEPEDLHISIDDDILTITGEIKTATGDGEGYSRRMETRHETFSHSFQLPCSVTIDETKATFKNGILNIIVPKCKPEPTRRIKIKVKK